MRTLFLLLALGHFSITVAQDFRYTEVPFPAAQVTGGVVYGQAPFLNFPYSNENNTTLSDLVLDVYQPSGDSHQQRAAIIFAHSGGFIVGDRTHDDMVALCDSFARKGYVTATIDYRQGFYLLNNIPLHGIRAVYRGIQDGRAAVRFLRANAAAYGIDPDHVYLAGSSAGAFISLQSIYLSTPDEIPSEVGVNTYTDIFFEQTTPDLGPPDIGANLNENGTPNGVIGLWGAVASPDWVDPLDNQPVFLAHGSADATVPFTIGPPFGVGAFPDVYGSAVIADELSFNGSGNFETYLVAGGEHEFHGTDNGTWENGQGGNARWDTLVQRVTNFLWEQHRPTADFTVGTVGLQANFMDASTGAVDWLWSFGDGITSTAEHPTHTYAAPGDYDVRLYVENAIKSWDTLRQTITVEALPLPLSWLGAPAANWVGKDVEVTWSVSDLLDVSHFTVQYADETDGAFRDLGTVAVTEDALTADFSFMHQAPAGTTHAYRIQYHDIAGTGGLSEIAILTGAEKLQAWPNPTRSKVNLSGFGEEYEVVQVTDLVGKVFTLPVRNAAVDLTRLPAGWYVLRFGPEGNSIPVLKLD